MTDYETQDITENEENEDMDFGIDYLSFLDAKPGMSAASGTIKEKKETSHLSGAGKQIISGSDIEEESEEESEKEDLGSLLQKINQENLDKVREEEEKRQEILRKEEEEELQKREERKAALIRERSERERLEREEYERAEAERIQREQEEELQRKQESLLYKTGELAKNLSGNLAGRLSELTIKKRKEKENQEPSEELEEELETNASRERFPEKTRKKEKPSKEKSEENSTDTSEKERKARTFPKLFSGKKKGEESPLEEPLQEEKEEKPAKKSEKKSKEKSKEKDYEYLALHDKLTGLFNQTAWDGLQKKKVKAGAAVLFVDANGLKLINDNLGHEMGNLLLTTIANTLQEHFGAEHCYRIGGDEFVIFLEQISEGELKRKVAGFRIALEDETKKREDRMFFSASIGTALSKEGKETLQELCNKADKEMYKVKELFKKNHPELDARNALSKKYFAPEGKETSRADLSDEEYDDLLNSESKELKELIRCTHRRADAEKTEKIIAEIQKRASEIYGILIADRTFNNLFIFSDAESFLDMFADDEMDLDDLDYSYLYVIYQGGPQYYASDDYYSEVTHLFEDIAKAMCSRGPLTDKALLKIKGIEIFKNIQFC